jgi:hypothetical protein
VILNDGNEASAGADILYNVEVYFRTTGSANLNAAAPRLADDDYIFAQHIRGKWWYAGTAQKTVDC